MPVYQSGLLGQAEQEFAVYNSNPVRGNSDLGKTAFLELMMAQLQHQDPLNPVADTDFTAQLAQFSSLEQLTNINTGVETLNTGTERQQMLEAVSFIGKEITAAGNSLSKKDGKISSLSFELSEAAADVTVNIFDSNGNIVDTIEMGQLQSGSYDVDWDGQDENGSELADGVYLVFMGAENAEGNPIMVSPEATGIVEGVEVVGSSYYLRLEDGRKVDLVQISEVVSPGTEEKEESEQSE